PHVDELLVELPRHIPIPVAHQLKERFGRRGHRRGFGAGGGLSARDSAQRQDPEQENGPRALQRSHSDAPFSAFRSGGSWPSRWRTKKSSRRRAAYAPPAPCPPLGTSRKSKSLPALTSASTKR